MEADDFAQAIPPSVLQHQKRAVADKRPAFEHGNNLNRIVYLEAFKALRANAYTTVIAKPLSSFKSFFPAAFRQESSEAYEPNTLNLKSRGWLKHLWRKATTEDDWSIDGDPLPWWDRWSSAPMLSFPRFDCSESSYFLLLAGNRTPAWREVYVEILDGLLKRHVSFWGAVDWNTQFGNDPDNNNYPYLYKGTLIPSGEKFKTNYNAPGWTGNGLPHPVEESSDGVCPDVLDANAMLFFKGWLCLVMGIRQRLGGDKDSQWMTGFHVSGVNDIKFKWNFQKLAHKLTSQFGMNNGAGLN